MIESDLLSPPDPMIYGVKKTKQIGICGKLNGQNIYLCQYEKFLIFLCSFEMYFVSASMGYCMKYHGQRYPQFCHHTKYVTQITSPKKSGYLRVVFGTDCLERTEKKPGA